MGIALVDPDTHNSTWISLYWAIFTSALICPVFCSFIGTESWKKQWCQICHVTDTKCAWRTPLTIVRSIRFMSSCSLFYPKKKQNCMLRYFFFSGQGRLWCRCEPSLSSHIHFLCNWYVEWRNIICMMSVTDIKGSSSGKVLIIFL